jgi:hypothetical protein
MAERELRRRVLTLKSVRDWDAVDFLAVALVSATHHLAISVDTPNTFDWAKQGAEGSGGAESEWVTEDEDEDEA